VDQVRQQELQARNRYVVAVEDYRTALDRFKITLHLPLETSIGLDEGELEKLAAGATALGEPEVEQAVATALRLRLDVMTARDQAEDASRQVRVTADALRAQLDLNVTASLPSGAGGAQVPLHFNGQNATVSAGFDLNLPFDRRAERNLYASSIIQNERQLRSESLFEDTVRATVRESHRRLAQERQTYQIQEASVRLAQARVESTNALRDAGRAETRDILDSQSALIDARNGLTSALINLTIAKLEFQSDTGTLRVESQGRMTAEPIPREAGRG